MINSFLQFIKFRGLENKYEKRRLKFSKIFSAAKKNDYGAI